MRNEERIYTPSFIPHAFVHLLEMNPGASAFPAV